MVLILTFILPLIAAEYGFGWCPKTEEQELDNEKFSGFWNEIYVDTTKYFWNRQNCSLDYYSVNGDLMDLT